MSGLASQVHSFGQVGSSQPLTIDQKFLNANGLEIEVPVEGLTDYEVDVSKKQLDH